MIRLSVPAIFDDELLNTYTQLNIKYENKGIKICEAYGSLPEIASAREPSRLPTVNEQQFFTYVNKLQHIGINFDYTLNSTVITQEYIDRFVRKFLEELWENGIRIITVASPLLVEYMHREFPKFTIVASTIMGIDSLNRIRQLKTFGADRITLDIGCNRNFKLLHLLKELKKKLGAVEFETLVNEFCGDCSMRNMHYNLQSLNASSYVSGDRFFDNYPFNVCTRLFMLKTQNILKTYWILPDWMQYYNEVCGIEWMKITGRTIKDITWHKFVVEEYMKQQYKGNVLDLGPLVIGGLKYEGRKSKVYLDSEILKNKAYIDYFISEQPDCKSICGLRCSFCDNLAKEMKESKIGVQQ